MQPKDVGCKGVKLYPLNSPSLHIWNRYATTSGLHPTRSVEKGSVVYILYRMTHIPNVGHILFQKNEPNNYDEVRCSGLHQVTHLQVTGQNALMANTIQQNCTHALRIMFSGDIGCVPVHIRSSLLHHGLLSLQDLLGVEDVEEVDRHVERHWDVLPHGVGHLILWVDHGVLT